MNISTIPPNDENTEEDSAKYIFDLPNLQKGDILLSSENTKKSRAIGAITGGQFSHAMLYVGNSLIHAMPDGVYSKNPQRLLFKSPAYIIALRSNNPLTVKQSNLIEEEARRLTGSLYSIYEAGKSQIKRNTTTKSKTQKQYCSKLVAQCYAKAGINIVSNPDYCSPNDIFRSGHLAPVDGYFRLATEQDLAILKKHDYNLELQKATFKWLGKVRDLSSKHKGTDVQTVNDAFSFLIRNSKFDKEIAREIKSSGYLNFYNADRAANPFRYSLEGFMHQMNASQLPPEDFIQREQDINTTEWNNRVKNLQKSKENYTKFPLECFQLECKLHENIIDELSLRMRVIMNAKKQLNIEK